MGQARAGVVIALAVVTLVQCAVLLGWLESLELLAFDSLQELQWDAAPGQPATTIIWQTEEEIQTFGFPLSGGRLTDVLEAVLKHSPRAVGVDLYRDTRVPPGEERLEELLLGDHRVVVVEKLADAANRAIHAPAYLGFEQVGFADMPVDDDGTVRRMFLMLWDSQDNVHFSFSLALALLFLEAEGTGSLMTQSSGNPDHVALGGMPLPALESNFGGYRNLDAGGYQIMFDLRGRSAEIPHFTMTEVLEGSVPAEMIAQRVIVIATASPSVKDQFRISSGIQVYGGQLHALATDQLIRAAMAQQAPIAGQGGTAQLAWLALWTLAGVALGFVMRNPLIVGMAGLLLVVGVGSAAFIALAGDLWVTSAAPALSSLLGLGLTIAYGSRQEYIEKTQMMRLFGQFVSREIVDEIWKERDTFMEGQVPKPQRAPVTVVQSDLGGFTAASSRLAPAEVMEWIGQYMEEMATLVERHGGVVSDFTGDGLMANFGVPVVRRHAEEVAGDARNAVRCALAMGEHMGRINALWRSTNLPEARVRIGVCSGEVISGAYGSRAHLKYATVGTPVNTAARLEGIDKTEFDAEDKVFRVLVSDSTWELLGGSFEGECLRSAELKGIDRPVRIYRVYAEKRHG